MLIDNSGKFWYESGQDHIILFFRRKPKKPILERSFAYFMYCTDSYVISERN